MSKQIWKMVGLLIVVSMALAACGTPAAAPATPQATANPYDDTAPITVWIDQDRQPMVDAYLKANPDKASLIKAVVVDREQFPAKVLLFNNTNQGWPDVVFAEPRLVARVADAAHNFPLDLTGWVSADVISNFAGIDNCKFDGKVFCLRNDLAMFVTYYNKPLMDQFGYTVPTTYEEMQALSDKVAKDHPGYLLGTFGDGWTFLSYFEGSGCPTHQMVDANTIKIDITDPTCVRAANLVDHMLANKTLYNTDFFNTDFDALITDNKLLMMEGPAWMWGVFGGTTGGWYTTADHQLGVAAPLKWQADSGTQVAAMGGAGWTVSRHTKNPNLAVDFIKFVTTNETLWTGTTNFPAYKPLMPLWQKAVSSNPLFANDPFPVFQAAASEISALDNWPRFDLISPLTQVVQDAFQQKKTILQNLGEVTSLFTPLAQAQGYNVVNK